MTVVNKFKVIIPNLHFNYSLKCCEISKSYLSQIPYCFMYFLWIIAYKKRILIVRLGKTVGQRLFPSSLLWKRRPTDGDECTPPTVITSAFETKWVAPKLDNKASVWLQRTDAKVKQDLLCSLSAKCNEFVGDFSRIIAIWGWRTREVSYPRR